MRLHLKRGFSAAAIFLLVPACSEAPLATGTPFTAPATATPVSTPTPVATPFVTPTIPPPLPGSVVVAPSSLTFDTLFSTQTLSVSQAENLDSVFTVTGCQGLVTVKLTGTPTVDVMSLAAGTCSLTVTGIVSSAVQIPITITTSTVTGS